MSSCFAFLPHVRVQTGQEVKVGPFILWGNAPQEWAKRFGVDNSAFFEMYRDRRGKAVGQKASILSRPDYTEASYEEFRDAVYCLSSAIWIRDSGASDSWVFERWHIDVPTPRDLAYQRISKFGVNFTSARNDHVYPTPYTHRIDISPYNDQDSIDRFAQELVKPRAESMLTAFNHFHLARFDTPYFTSPGDSIESMWSGFESLLEIDKIGVVSSPENEREQVHVGKDEKLLRALRAEFARHGVEYCPEFWKGIEVWVKQFYKERNYHSHGVRSDLAAERIDPYGLSSFSVAIYLARAILQLRLFGDNFLKVEYTAAELNSLFMFIPVTLRVVRTLRDYDRKVWFPGTGEYATKLSSETLDAFKRDLLEFVGLRTESQQLRGDSRVAQARQKMGLVLSEWVRELRDNPPANAELGSITEIPETISSLLAEGKEAEAIDTELAQLLIDSGAARVETYGEHARPEQRLTLRGQIAIWLWIDAYIRLTEVWLGHKLR